MIRSCVEGVAEREPTLRRLDALDALVVDTSRARLDELVTFLAEVEHLRALDTQLDQLFDRNMHDVGCGLSMRAHWSAQSSRNAHANTFNCADRIPCT